MIISLRWRSRAVTLLPGLASSSEQADLEESWAVWPSIFVAPVPSGVSRPQLPALPMSPPRPKLEVCLFSAWVQSSCEDSEAGSPSVQGDTLTSGSQEVMFAKEKA